MGNSCLKNIVGTSLPSGFDIQAASQNWKGILKLPNPAFCWNTNLSFPHKQLFFSFLLPSASFINTFFSHLFYYQTIVLFLSGSSSNIIFGSHLLVILNPLFYSRYSWMIKNQSQLVFFSKQQCIG